MKYQTGEIGKVILAHFEDGDEIISNIISIIRKERIKGCIFYLLGGLAEGRIVVGPVAGDVQPPEPTWREITDSHETLAIGTVFWDGDEPRVHIHGTYGKFDSVKTGCLRDEAKTYIVMESVILELKGIEAVREIHPDFQMALLKLLDR